MPRYANARELIDARDRLIARHGPWTTPVDLGLGVSACDPALDPTGGTRLNRVLQLTRDVAGRPLEGVRILDLACLEGMISLPLAHQGARVLGIEARESNVARAAFARDAWDLSNLEFLRDDVRNLSLDVHGSWEIVLGLGILYHLPAPDVFDFVARVFEVTGRAAILDTHVSGSVERELLGPPVTHRYRGNLYRGRDYREFDPESRPEDRLRSAWSTLDARPSFWPTQASLLNLLADAGFTSVCEARMPVWRNMPADRITLVAFKGPRVDGALPERFGEDDAPSADASG
jgi:hypothetical protein